MSDNERLALIESQILQIQERNKKVESEKAWETSKIRIISIACTTYIVMVIFMFYIGVKDFYISAIVPTLGFLLSTLSMSFIKKFWLRRKI